MNREKLIEQVKNEYARIASDDSQQHFHQTTTELTPETYYEKLLQAVIDDISIGVFDDFHTGREIVEAVANDKRWLSEWND